MVLAATPVGVIAGKETAVVGGEGIPAAAGRLPVSIVHSCHSSGLPVFLGDEIGLYLLESAKSKLISGLFSTP